MNGRSLSVSYCVSIQVAYIFFPYSGIAVSMVMKYADNIVKVR